MWGVIALQFTDSDILPYNYTEYGAQLGNFYTSIVTLMKVKKSYFIVKITSKTMEMLIFLHCPAQFQISNKLLPKLLMK